MYISRFSHRIFPILLAFGCALALCSISGFADSADMTGTGFTISLSGLSPFGNQASNVSGKGALLKILENVSDFLLIMIPLIAAISGIIAGYYYIFSSGDSDKAGLAKRIIQYNIMAIVVAFLSYAIIKFIANILS